MDFSHSEFVGRVGRGRRPRCDCLVRRWEELERARPWCRGRAPEPAWGCIVSTRPPTWPDARAPARAWENGWPGSACRSSGRGISDRSRDRAGSRPRARRPGRRARTRGARRSERAGAHIARLTWPGGADSLEHAWVDHRSPTLRPRQPISCIDVGKRRADARACSGPPSWPSGRTSWPGIPKRTRGVRSDVALGRDPVLFLYSYACRGALQLSQHS